MNPTPLTPPGAPPSVLGRAAWPPPNPNGAPIQPPTQPPAPPREPGLDRSDLTPKPTFSRALWMIFGSVMMLGALFWGSFSIVSVLAHEEWDVSYRESAEGITTVRVNGNNGRVVVRGADTDEIAVDARVSRGLFGIEESAGRVGDEFSVESDCPPLGGEWCSTDYDITVPRGMDLVIDADNGRVVISHIDGAIDVDTDNGRVELASVSGAVRVRGDNGGIVGTALTGSTVDVATDNGGIDLAFATPPDSVTASTDNGGIRLALPDVEGGYDVVPPVTDNGRTSVDVVSDPSSPREIRTETDNGSIAIVPAG